MEPTTESRRPNQLGAESSPYLLQHAYNPVDWYPWSPEALEKARREDKPILLSIGYSACHWCHVMERESFEEEETAGLMNRHFVNIKVDREERPDLDAIYMNFVQMTTGSGGWPLTVFLTPDQVPFYGGTYFPPQDSYGRPGFRRILQTIAEIYRTRREELETQRHEIVSHLQETSHFKTPDEPIREELLDESYHNLLKHFDGRHGGFGGAPKFPSSMALAFLLRYHLRRKEPSALKAVELSLTEMARGGIYDHVGGGFHRYSVDERWLVPHFEKMLYDNALLARLYLEAYQVTGNSCYREVAEETLAFVIREMRDPQGGFYSALDADSEGEEGKYYVWTPEEVEAALGADEAAIFNDYYDITASGNFEGANIPHPRYELEAFSRRLGRSPEELKRRLDEARRRLLETREKRVRPGLDDKVLAAWNGLMLTAFAEAAFVLNRPEYREIALDNAAFLAGEMVVDGRLMRSWKGGRARFNAYLEDYAQVIEGWISTYQISGEVRWLEEAARMMDRQFELFLDAENGGFFFTSVDHETLLVRPKEHLDNATPSGNSTSCLNLLRLAELRGTPVYRETAERMLRGMGKGASGHPLGLGNWLQALDFLLGPSDQICVVGPRAEQERLLDPVRRTFLPRRVLVRSEDPSRQTGIPLLEGKEAREGQAILYLCRDFTCRSPATSPDEVQKILEEESARIGGG